jgi:non-ribosomal peptide synthetase component F
MCTHLVTLFHSIVADPRTKISKLQVMTSDEREIILKKFNKQRHENANYVLKDNDDCVHRRFERQTRETPNAVALVDYTLSQTAPFPLSYSQLNARANSLAHYLRTELGLTTGSVVAIIFHRCHEWLVSLLAVLKAGCTYVPIDPSYPKDRITFMIADSRARAVLTHRKAKDVIRLPSEKTRQAVTTTDTAVSTSSTPAAVPPSPTPSPAASYPSSLPAPFVVLVDVDWSFISTCPHTDPVVGVSLSHPVYIVYTSGSTGNTRVAERERGVNRHVRTSCF